MTNKDFKEIRTRVLTLEKVHQPTSGKIVGILLNGILYSQGRKSDKLTRKQLEYFEFLNDFEIDKAQNI